MKVDLHGRDKKGDVYLAIDVDNQFETEGIWLRGSLHCHVSKMGDSDRVCRHYRNLGFNLLASTDYLNITALPAPSEVMVTLHGAEMFNPDQSDLTHIVCLGLHEEIRPLNGTIQDIHRLVNEVNEQGGLAILAHPAWSGYSYADMVNIANAGIAGFELTNRCCWKINGKNRSEELWQTLLDQGIRLAAIGVDDAHDITDDMVTGAAWTGVLVSETSVKGVLEAICAHRTYASEGPQIKGIHFDAQGLIAIECSPCIACHVRSRGFGVRSVVSKQSNQNFEIDLKKDGYRMQDWVSVCIEDAFGRRAWSSAIPVRIATHPL